MLNKILLIIVTVFMLSGQEARAVGRGELMSDFIYNLVDYVKWNAKQKVAICTHGHDSVTYNIEKIDVSTSPLINTPNVEIKTDVKLQEVQHCNLIYIAQDQEKHLLKIFETIENMPILSVSSIPNFIGHNGIMEFKVRRGKIKLKVNDEALKKADIKLSPTILMAISSHNNSG